MKVEWWTVDSVTNTTEGGSSSLLLPFLLSVTAFVKTGRENSSFWSCDATKGRDKKSNGDRSLYYERANSIVENTVIPGVDKGRTSCNLLVSLQVRRPTIRSPGCFIYLHRSLSFFSAHRRHFCWIIVSRTRWYTHNMRNVAHSTLFIISPRSAQW